jgi:hypothetical protein
MSKQNHSQNSTKSDPTEMLGEVLGHYPIYRQGSKRWTRILVGVLAILSSIGLIILLGIKTWDRINIHGRALILSVFPLPTVLYAFLFFAGVILIILAIIYWRDGITLFEKGLVQITARKVKTWDYQGTNRFDSHIAQVTFGGSLVSTRMKIILENKENSRLVIHNRYERMTELIEALRTLILPNLIVESRRQLLLGAELVFHKKIRANQSAMMINGEQIPYDNLAVVVENQAIKLHDKADPSQVVFKSKIQHIKNLDLLFALLENPPHG